MNRVGEQAVREHKERLGEQSIAYYGIDGKIYIYDNEKVCREAISEKDLAQKAFYVLFEGVCIQSAEIVDID